ncbi:PPOX class F420-dependent oxidoreductase [Candidatus Nitrosocosmicus arcticus]|uniref:Pyridoxamine 5'-phosphate oxidase family protein n=1 Tax=Candidatus Nitrosocosmicus arcticus TaxID=2035267 RepID=A0A557SU13_9ARCH|nr:PPOX class F420-dependent oxidoreductase [Candidatus Nitrosocosmicus arcticus]TVP40101.1 Pyridoxamine 5'-phosphate oxidase family protein [Candidatus Nitrosocosmicus arcticus]
MPANTQQFENESYLNLETYRKNNHPIVTPVWFIRKDKDIFVVTREKTGKVKRIKNNNVVRVAPCNYRGVSKGTWVAGTARFVDSQEKRDILRIRSKKYGIKAKIASLLSIRKGDYVVIAVQV